MRYPYLFLVSFMAAQAGAESAPSNMIPYKVNLDLAHTEVKTGTGLDYKEGFVDQQTIPNKDGFFVMHEAVNKPLTTGKGNPIYEWYVVNAWMVDVWTVGQCERLSNPSLHGPLAKLKALFHDKELKEYDRLCTIPAYRINVRTQEPDMMKRCGEGANVDYSEMGAAAHDL